MNTEQKGIQLLLGKPNKTIVKLAIPIMLSQFAVLLYSLADGFWVAGIGKNALACIGAFLPVSLIITAVYSGFSNAAVSILSKTIGADRRNETNQAGKIIFFFMILIFFGMLVLGYILINDFYQLLGLNIVLEKALIYARIMFVAFAFSGLNNIFEAFLRSEGSTKTIGNTCVASSLLNIVLDPIFIYQFQMGVKGAAIASVISAFVGSCVYFYIYFIKNDKYIKIILKPARKINSRTIYLTLTKLGFSLSLSQLFFSLLIFANSTVISRINGIDGITVYTIGLRWIVFTLIPIMGIAAVQIGVIGAAFGNKDFNRLIKAFNYILVVAVVIESFIAMITFIFANEITSIFTWSENVPTLHNEFIIFFKIISFVLPSQTISIVCSASFAGIGKGLNALIIDALRTCLFTFPFVLFFSLYMKIGLHGVWYGIVMGNYMTALISIVWFTRYKKKLV